MTKVRVLVVIADLVFEANSEQEAVEKAKVHIKKYFPEDMDRYIVYHTPQPDRKERTPS